MSEIGKRWAVAAVGVPLVLVLLYVGGWPIGLVVAALAALGAWECYRLADHGGVAALDVVGAVAAAALVLAAASRPTFSSFAPVALGLVGTLSAVALVLAMARRGPARKPLEVVAITVFGAIYAGLSLAFVPLLHAMPTERLWTYGGSVDASRWGGLLIVALPLAATWIGDAAAFIDPFTGSGMLMALESGELVAKVILCHPHRLHAGASLATDYKVRYREKFESRLRVCSLLRRAAFRPRLAEWGVAFFGASERFRNLVARSTRSPKTVKRGSV